VPGFFGPLINQTWRQLNYYPTEEEVRSAGRMGTTDFVIDLSDIVAQGEFWFQEFSRSGTGASTEILLPARPNNLTYIDAFDLRVLSEQSSRTSQGLGVVRMATATPDGGISAFRLIEIATTGTDSMLATRADLLTSPLRMYGTDRLDLIGDFQGTDPGTTYTFSCRVLARTIVLPGEGQGATPYRIYRQPG